MNPDKEYMIRQLAYLIIEGDRDRVSPGVLDAGEAKVTVELQGMVHGIRRQILVDSAAVATKVAAEIKRQASAIDLDKLIAKEVAAEIARLRSSLVDLVHQHVKRAAENEIHERADGFVKSLVSKAVARLYKEVLK